MTSFGGMIDNEIAKLRVSKECDHVWVGPITEIEPNLHNTSPFYLVNCKHCSLAKATATREEAEIATAPHPKGVR